jgi:hypothetical protein
MFNPLFGNPADLKDSELEDKINELSRKYAIAARTGMNQVIPQIILALNMYKDEMSKRSREALQNTAKRSNGNLDDLINID